MIMQNHQVSVLEELPNIGQISINWSSLSHFNFDQLNIDGIVLFQFLVYHCAKLEPKHEGWFYHSKDEIKKKIGINRERLDTLTRKLEGMGLLEKQLKGVPARLFYRIRFEELTKPEQLKIIYKKPTPEKLKELQKLYQRCIQSDAPQTPGQIKAEKIAKQRAEETLKELVNFFQSRRDYYNQQSKKTGTTRILNNVALPTKSSHITMMKNLLSRFSVAQIQHAFTPYCDLINFTSGGKLTGHGMPLNLEPPKQDILSYFLSKHRDFEIFRKCMTAGYDYGHTPSPPANFQDPKSKQSQPFDDDDDVLPF